MTKDQKNMLKVTKTEIDKHFDKVCRAWIDGKMTLAQAIEASDALLEFKVNLTKQEDRDL